MSESEIVKWEEGWERPSSKSFKETQEAYRARYYGLTLEEFKESERSISWLKKNMRPKSKNPYSYWEYYRRIVTKSGLAIADRIQDFVFEDIEGAIIAHILSKNIAYIDIDDKRLDSAIIIPKNQIERDEIRRYYTDTGDCYLTTACVTAARLPGDCLELQTLRAYRDTYVKGLPDGEGLTGLYYKVSPLIVAAIQQRPDSQKIFSKGLVDVRETVSMIQQGDYEGALRQYGRLFQQLNEYVPPGVLREALGQDAQLFDRLELLIAKAV